MHNDYYIFYAAGVLAFIFLGLPFVAGIAIKARAPKAALIVLVIMSILVAIGHLRMDELHRAHF